MGAPDLSASVEKMRNRLKAIESIAMSALCNQPENTLECWKHLGAAEGKIYELVNVGFRKLVHDAKMKAEGAVDAMRRMRRSKRERDDMLDALVRIGNWCAQDLAENAYLSDSSGNYLKTLNGLCEVCRPFMKEAIKLKRYGGAE